MLHKDHNRGDRIIKPPSVINVQKTETDPHVVNAVNLAGIIPSPDLLIDAVSSIPVPYGVVANKPASTVQTPNLEYMQNFKNAYVGGKYLDQVVTSK